MPIKIVEIDENIMPVVLWLNIYFSVYTLFSCEGGQSEAYVLFICTRMEDLRDIQGIIDFCHTQADSGVATWNQIKADAIVIQTNMFAGLLRFKMLFDSKDTIRAFCKYLINNHIEIEEQ